MYLITAVVWVLLASSAAVAGQPAYVAGQFYPDQASELASMVQSFLGEPTARAERPRALIVPHAGYPFSGAVAGAGFREISGADFNVVILVGLAHRVPVEAAAIDPSGTFETPLGKIEVDTATAERLMTLSPLVRAQPEAFVGEHSLEVELPFLQEALASFQIVPILMQEPDLDEAKAIGEALAAVVKENEAKGVRTLLVASTDLSHYPKDADARRSDEAVLARIAAVDPEGLFEEAKAQVAKGIAGLDTAICGEAGTLAVLYAARALVATSGRTVARATSADSLFGDRERVVGYGAVALYGSSLAAGEKAEPGTARAAEPLTADQEKRLLADARAALAEFLKTGTPPAREPSQEPALREPAAVFVTLKKAGDLRGCIGTTMPTLPLEEAVRHYAIAAGTQDARFQPVTAEELDSLSLEISLLSPPHPVASPGEIRPGEDGVVLVAGEHGGLFLPQVWHDTGWTREEFLSQLANQKAGLAPDAWKDPATQLYTFTVHAFEDKP